MKKKYTQKRSARRTSNYGFMYNGKSKWTLGALFGVKSGSKTQQKKAKLEKEKLQRTTNK